jgi:hypothetical protein
MIVNLNLSELGARWLEPAVWIWMPHLGALHSHTEGAQNLAGFGDSTRSKHGYFDIGKRSIAIAA